MTTLNGPEPRKMWIANESSTKTFQYNPETLTFRNEAKWVKHQIAGIHDPRLQYAGGSGTTINLELELWGGGPNGGTDVDRDVTWLESLTLPVESPGNHRAPARLRVYFGEGRRYWTCVLEDVSTEHKLFYSDMRTRHATVALTLFGDYVAARMASSYPNSISAPISEQTRALALTQVEE
jgi:hypothetical protein